MKGGGKLKRKSFISFMVLIVFAIVIGFLSKSFAEEKPNVVFVLKDLNSQYWEIVKAGAEKGFRDFGVDGRIVAPSRGTGEEQRDLLQGVLNENPDVLVVSPIYIPMIIPVLDEFVERNIPILFLDTDASWEHKIAYIGTDNFDLGRKAGSLLASQLQPGDEVAVIGGDVTSPVSGERIEGARLSLNAVQVNIATEKVNLTNEATSIKDATKEIIKEHPNIKGIIATNDVIALQVVNVLEEHGLSFQSQEPMGLLK